MSRDMRCIDCGEVFRITVSEYNKKPTCPFCSSHNVKDITDEDLE